MYTGYYYPHYRRWGYPVWGNPYYGYGRYYGNNIIGSAVANQNMNIIGGAGVIGTQFASPVAIW